VLAAGATTDAFDGGIVTLTGKDLRTPAGIVAALRTDCCTYSTHTSNASVALITQLFQLIESQTTDTQSQR